jgi:putative nucleotidyltransferase with HDIG domain
MLAFILLDTESFSAMNVQEILMVAGFGLMNGVFSGILANGVLPYMESMFSLATSSRLLELADLSQPLLKRLAEEAPGTYQHSVAVATLAEAAANGINADPLLTKIAAYFHDIGKLKRPMYFSENQSDENRHDQVTPYMSSLILIGHIRDSLDLGREYGLPERVLSIMSQHHGTTLISYFFEEAKKNKDGEEVNEERFRYPGPKPQTKEAAIVMLADSVEAAARTLPQHTHSKIEGLVQKIIEHKLNDENQLDESDLTLKDIEKIEQIFVRTISSMYHGRIDYPGKLSNQPKGATDGSSDQ